jgi:holo-[acyl-carrier protein] synthase
VILGFGSDLCDIRRIERALARFGGRFLERVFTEAERARAERRSGTARTGTYAKRFAAKEACAKALGTGFAQGVFMSDLGVINLPSGLPTLILTGAAARRLVALTPPGFSGRIDLTMSDEYPYAFAQVIISAEPLGPRARVA